MSTSLKTKINNTAATSVMLINGFTGNVIVAKLGVDHEKLVFACFWCNAEKSHKKAMLIILHQQGVSRAQLHHIVVVGNRL